jgi:CRP/FNR family transcriptional regulator, cyclic AMP receptor protein
VSRIAIDKEQLLASLEPSLGRLAAQGILTSFPKNTIVLHEGDYEDFMFILLDGRVKAYSTSADGREIVYDMIQANDCFGELALDGGARSASVMAMGPVICSIVSSRAVHEHMNREPVFAVSMAKRAMRSTRSTTALARCMRLFDVYGHLAHLLESSHVFGDSRRTPGRLEGLTQQDISSLLGCSREMVSRLLADMKRRGYVEVGYKRITVLKKLPPRL